MKNGNVKTDNAASFRVQEKYIKQVRVSWPPVVAALLLSKLTALQNSYVKSNKHCNTAYKE
jgi:hypothetical protein